MSDPRTAILDFLRKHRDGTAAQIAAAIGVSPKSVGQISKALIADGLILRVDMGGWTMYQIR